VQDLLRVQESVLAQDSVVLFSDSLRIFLPKKWLL
jgi:hypothetical protein